MFRCDCGEGVFNTVAQIGHDCSELSCSKRFPSNLRRCNHGWFKKADVLPGRVW